MRILLSLKPENWSLSVATKMRQHAEGWALPPEEFILAAWAAEAGKLTSLFTIINGLVALGEASGWQAQSMLISEAGTVPIFDGETQTGTRQQLELAVTLVARADNPEESVRGLTKPDTWLSETLPPDVRDALLECWAALAAN